MKSSRGLSFFLLTVVYLVATAVGVVVYLWLGDMPTWAKLLIADIVATVATFLCSVVFKNASVYDPYWSVAPIVIVYAFLWNTEITAAKLLMVIAVTLWGVRLTANWAYTFHGLNHQDWRYTMLQEKTGALYPFVNFLGIHLVPTLVVYACVLPVVYLLEGNPSLNAGTVIFFVCALGAATLQGVADCQMHRFRKSGRGGFIRDGLWKYSRHPNYLGEISMWWSVALFAVCSLGFSWVYLFGAAANTCLFLFISIPLAEGRQARKEGFADYKKQTRMLLPVYKKQ